jgi:hypothetical protein
MPKIRFYKQTLYNISISNDLCKEGKFGFLKWFLTFKKVRS